MTPTASILLVDDDSAFRHVMSGELRRLGHDVADRRVRRGSVRKAGQPDPDIVLLDLRLPGMDGLERAKGDPRAQPGRRNYHADRPRLDRYRHRIHPRRRV